MILCSINHDGVRVFAFILAFTPSLGLFDTLHHGRLAALAVDINANKEQFNYPINHINISFKEAWDKFRLDDATQFLDLPTWAVLILLVVGLVLHIFASSCIVHISTKGKANVRIMAEGFYTLITPPLHLDWEFYHDSNKRDPIKLCWKKYSVYNYIGELSRL